MNGVSGFYCRHDSCTKKFVNKLSRAGHESNCQYRKGSSKSSKGKKQEVKKQEVKKQEVKEPTNVLKPTFDPSSNLYKVDPKVKSKYGDVIFGRPAKNGNLHAIVINDHPNVSYCIVEPATPEKPASPSSSSSSGIDSQSQESKTSRDNGIWSDEYSDNDVSVTTLSKKSQTSLPLKSESTGTESINDDSLKEQYEQEGKTVKVDKSEDEDEEEQHSCKVCRNCTKRENQLFCTSLAETLDRLDWRKQRIAKIKFQEILYDLEYDRI